MTMHHPCPDPGGDSCIPSVPRPHPHPGHFRCPDSKIDEASHPHSSHPYCMPLSHGNMGQSLTCPECLQDDSDSWSSMPAAGAASMWSPSGGIQSAVSSQPFGGGMSLFYTPKAFRIEEPTDATLSAASTAAATSANRDVEAASSLLSGLSLLPQHPAGPPSVGFESSGSSTLAQDADSGIVPMSTPSPPASFSRGRAWGVQPERLTFDEAPVATRSPGSSTVSPRLVQALSPAEPSPLSPPP